MFPVSFECTGTLKIESYHDVKKTVNDSLGTLSFFFKNSHKLIVNTKPQWKYVGGKFNLYSHVLKDISTGRKVGLLRLIEASGYFFEYFRWFIQGSI